MMEDEEAWASSIGAGQKVSTVFVSEQKGFGETNMLAESFCFSQKVCLYVQFSDTTKFSTGEKKLLLISVQTVDLFLFI